MPQKLFLNSGNAQFLTGWHQTLLRPKNCLGYYRFFSRKLVWFGIFWEQVPNIDIWGIIPTQFLSLNTDLLSKLKNLNIWKIFKFPSSLNIWHQGDFWILYLNLSFNFHSKFVFSGENWVGIIPHLSIFGTCSQNIPNQTSLREKNR